MAGAVFLPYITRFNAEGGYDYSELYDLIEGVDKDIPRKKKNKLFVEKMFELAKTLNVPSSLKEFGVNEDNIDKLLNDVEGLAGAFGFNPVPFTVENGRELLTNLIK